jgi:mycofactocin precursor
LPPFSFGTRCHNIGSSNGGDTGRKQSVSSGDSKEHAMSDASTVVDDRVDTEEITDAEALVDEDSLVEEVSIDGMCGVY